MKASAELSAIVFVAAILVLKSNGISRDARPPVQPTAGARTSFRSVIQDVSASKDGPNTRRVRLNLKEPNDPARIVKVMESGADVTPGARPYKMWEGKPFQADDNWVKNLTFIVKNLSNREIVAASLDLTFPETGTGSWGSPFYGEPISLGRRPARYVRVGGTKEEELRPAETTQPLHILPGQDITIPVSQYYDEIKKAIEQQPRPLAALRICTVQLYGVYFSDGLMWAQGEQFEKPDPNAAGRYIKISADEFWGRTKTPH